MHADDLVGQVSELVSLPEVCLRINELVDDASASVADIESTLMADPALAARILKVANSALFGQSRKVDTISRAIMLIGTNALRDIAVASCCIHSFKNISTSLVNMKTFWEHSLMVAVSAELIAEAHHTLSSQRLFLMGLLHDIGHLVMYQTIPVEMGLILEDARRENQSVELIEQQVLGLDHGEVGATLVHDWGLPASIVTTTRCHHKPDNAIDWKLETIAIQLADNLAKQMGFNGQNNEYIAQVDMKSWQLLGITERKRDDIVKEARARFESTQGLFLEPLNAAA
jgi:putative nucleotidyltransferase with HDIG domain